MRIKLSLVAAMAIDLYSRKQPIINGSMNNMETAMVIKTNELKQKNVKEN
jgi:hypothetical protein